MPNLAKYPSKERVERDGVLVHAEGDDLAGDPDEATRQGYKVDVVKVDNGSPPAVKAKPAKKSRKRS